MPLRWRVALLLLLVVALAEGASKFGNAIIAAVAECDEVVVRTARRRDEDSMLIE